MIRNLSTGERQRLKGVGLKPLQDSDTTPSMVYGEIKEFPEEFEDKDQKQYVVQQKNIIQFFDKFIVDYV